MLMHVNVTPDKMVVKLTVGTNVFDLNAKLVSDLLTQLMFARAEMLPAIPLQKPPKQLSLSVRTAHWGFGKDEPRRDPPDVILTLPHRGYGWIVYRFSLQRAERLNRDLAMEIQKNLPARGRTH